MVVKNNVLRKVFGPKRDEIIRGCRKLHNEELHNLYFRRQGGPDGHGTYNILVEDKFFMGNTEGKRPLGRSKHRWRYNIKVDLRDIGCGGKNRIDQVEEKGQWRALRNRIINFRVP
jgi:hypothetical protein